MKDYREHNFRILMAVIIGTFFLMCITLIILTPKTITIKNEKLQSQKPDTSRAVHSDRGAW